MMVKGKSNAGQTLGSSGGQILAKYWSNTGQILVKYWSNTGQILVKYWSNTSGVERWSPTRPQHPLTGV
jgi:hypothetical protein